MQKGEIDNVIYSDFDEQFQALAIIVIILMMVEVCILERKNVKQKKEVKNEK